MNEQVYGDERAQRLIELLRGLGARIASLHRDEDLLAAGPELLKLMGDARTELFHYEVRATYETPQSAESRRVVEEAVRRGETIDLGTGFDPDEAPGEGEPWRV